MKRIYIITFLLTIFFSPINSYSQTSLEDVVYLKNGNIIHGLIIEQIPNQSFKIQTRDGNIFVLKIEEIEKMTKEQLKKSRGSISDFEIKDLKKSGLSNITELYLSGWSNGKNSGLLGIQTINGYLINPKLNIGAGIGIEQIGNSSNTTIAYIPLFIDVRTYFLKNKVTPYFSIGLGYSFAINKKYYPSYQDVNCGGILINPALGGKFFITKNTALNFSFGYRFQQDHIKSFNDYKKYNINIENTNFFIIKIGVTF